MDLAMETAMAVSIIVNTTTEIGIPVIHRRDIGMVLRHPRLLTTDGRLGIVTVIAIVTMQEDPTQDFPHDLRLPNTLEAEQVWTDHDLTVTEIVCCPEVELV